MLFVLQMLVDLNTVLDSNIEVQGELPSYAAKNGFLNHIVVPIYEVVKAVRHLFFFSQIWMHTLSIRYCSIIFLLGKLS
jgi:hypothetical protein